ncbi:AP-3 complex subunit beta [Marchantia polymorpha subsp. ruderalis]|uniref:OVATE domain-containing protein n=2 Tax=Marchantia polymorpha TaxID=3197 RepID=A0AAF6BPE9_MARPO|nr:hypothetical protein MARPO_0053s0031 [Marchantia polymorpha]BBN13883.1 hypothetical protein Mp_6g07170 [Marchantia polymorpha subsp. ruderalis]|eukprot:PTQ38084.1 hypothetical protein MARPO_0053s0031 [Marchantia polymorpha]
MFPQFAVSAASFSRATALLTRVGTDAHFYDDPEAPNLAILLDSKYEAEKTEGMKRLIALMSQGRDVSNFFPQVVKNVASPSLELKKLVYIYLVHYAEKRPDEALLAINSFQKDLSDLNPLVRAWSLRAMSGIRVRVVLPLVVMAVNKCARDPSPYVRRCAAHAISKVFAMDREQHLETLEELIALLMNDNSPSVIGAVAAAFSVVCPDRLSLLGPRIQKLCELLPDVDEWGQVVLIDNLLRYAIGRHGFPKGSFGFLNAQQAKGLVQDDVYLEKREGQLLEMLQVGDAHRAVRDKRKAEVEEKDGGGKVSGFQAANELWLRNTPQEMDEPEEVSKDIQMLLQNTQPLLWSRNSAVVMASASVHWLLGRKEDVKKIVQPLVFLLRSAPETQYVVLANLSTFVKLAPSMFQAHYEDFFITSADSEQIRVLKLDILCLLATETSIKYILQEFQAYVRSPDRQFAADTVSAIGRCAVRLPSLAAACTIGLLLLARSGSVVSNDSNDVGKEDQEAQIKGHTTRYTPVRTLRSQNNGEKSSREAVVVTQAVLALRIIVQQRPLENEEVLARLIRGLDKLNVQRARAIVIWMIGEFSETGTLVPKMIPVVLQYLAGTFTKESDETKLQIMNCAAKVVLRSQASSDSASQVALLVFDTVLRLASQDLNYDIRDRARMLQQLLVLHLQGLSERSQKVEGDVADKLTMLRVQESSSILESVEGDDGEKTSSFNVDKPRNGKSSAGLMKLAEHIFLVPKIAPAVLSLTPDRSFLPGSMSHVVQHIAPDYRPLPQPFSIDSADSLTHVRHAATQQADSEVDSSSNGDYSGSGDEKYGNMSSPRSSSNGEHVEEENGESFLSGSGDSSSEIDMYQHSGRSKSASHPSSHSRSHRSGHEKRSSRDVEPLISLSDTEAGVTSGTQGRDVNQQPLSESPTAGFGLSSKDLDSWLGQEEMGTTSGSASGYANLSLGKIAVEPKTHTLLDFTNGGGLEVKYYTERIAVSSSEDQVYVKLLFHNRGSESLSGITVKEVESSKTSFETSESETSSSIPVKSEQVVSGLDPGSKAEGKLVVQFLHHFNPVKLSIVCNDKTYLVKLVLEVGVLIRPVPLSPEAFNSSQSRITGMHESSRRCILKVRHPSQGVPVTEDKLLVVARSIAQKVLTSAHVSLVSTTIPIGDSFVSEQAIKGGGVQGLRLRFSGKTLAESVLCLIEVAVLTETVTEIDCEQLEVLMKVNCENTVFGLTLLQELSKALSSSE